MHLAANAPLTQALRVTLKHLVRYRSESPRTVTFMQVLGGKAVVESWGLVGFIANMMRKPVWGMYAFFTLSEGLLVAGLGV